jgi:hypothetical protein
MCNGEMWHKRGKKPPDLRNAVRPKSKPHPPDAAAFSVLQWEPREWGARVLSGIEEYYQCALDCLRLANETNEQRTRTFLVDMAQRWNHWRNWQRRTAAPIWSMKRQNPKIRLVRVSSKIVQSRRLHSSGSSSQDHLPLIQINGATFI